MMSSIKALIAMSSVTVSLLLPMTAIAGQKQPPKGVTVPKICSIYEIKTRQSALGFYKGCRYLRTFIYENQRVYVYVFGDGNSVSANKKGVMVAMSTEYPSRYETEELCREYSLKLGYLYRVEHFDGEEYYCVVAPLNSAQ